MKKAITYTAVIAACAGFCLLYDHIGPLFKNLQKTNPWALTAGILLVAVIMAGVRHWVARHDDHDDGKTA